MSDILGRHTNNCDYCYKGYKWNGFALLKCPQCKGKGFVVEDLDEYIKGMRTGDILLIKNYFDLIGWIISIFTHCQWHHVAWAINRHELIEVKAIGKRKVSLSRYLNKYLYKCKLVRLTIDKDKLNEAIKRAKKTQFNYSYTSALINFLLIKLKITKKLPRLSCSGFIGSFLAQVGFYFCDKDPEFITPADIESSIKVTDITEELYQ